ALKEGPSNLIGGETAKESQGQGHARLRSEDGMAGDEDQPENIVTDPIVDRLVELRSGELLEALEVASDLFVLPFEHLVPAQPVDGPPFRRRHEPGARIARHSSLRP